MEKELIKFTNGELGYNIDNVIETLKNTKERFEKKGYRDINVVLATEWGYYDDNWPVCIVYGTELPPPKEKLTVDEILKSNKQQFHMD